MARADVDISLDRDAIFRLSVDTAEKLAGKAAQNVQARARRYAPKRTGTLAFSITIRKIVYGTRVVYEVGSDLDYAGYQEFGTGPISAKPGGVLRFESGGQIVFARRTSGVPATHFMSKAARAITAADFT